MNLRNISNILDTIIYCLSEMYYFYLR